MKDSKASTLAAEPALPPEPAMDSVPPPSHAPASASQTMHLKLEITGLKSKQGQCPIAIYIEEGFNDPDQAIFKETLNIDGDPIMLSVSLTDWMQARGLQSLEGLKLAVSAYHDLNSNGKLDKNSFGIPTEPYGFSRDPKRGFGPPSFEQAAVEIDPAMTSETPISIRLH
ncbi:MAG: DUF2141 domain-containing protein [Pirellula sp.]